jgi:putative glutamine amidotransferase
MNKINTPGFFAMLFLLVSPGVLAAPTAQTSFKELIGQEFVDDGTNTVHEWVYDFLLAVEEGDEELLRERLEELKQADAGNRALLLNAGAELAKELGRDLQWQMLKGRLNRIASIPATFSLEAAEACELTHRRNAEKAQEAGKWSFGECLMSSMACRTLFVVAVGLPVASCANVFVNTANKPASGALSQGCGLSRKFAKELDALFVKAHSAPTFSETLGSPLTSVRRAFRALPWLATEGPCATATDVVQLINLEENTEELKELIPHLLSNKIIDQENVWREVLHLPSDRVEAATRFLLEAGANPNLVIRRGRPLLLALLENSHLFENRVEVAELLLDYGADPMPVLQSLHELNHLKYKDALMNKLVNHLDVVPEHLFYSITKYFNSQLRKAGDEYYDEEKIETILKTWNALILKGLPIDVSASISADTYIPWVSQSLKRFIERLLETVDIDIQKREENGKCFWENAMEVGSEKSTELLLGRLIDGGVDVNRPQKDGYSVFERMLVLGKFQAAETLAKRGGRTHRPVVVVITDSSRDGIMYSNVGRELEARNILVTTLTVNTYFSDATRSQIKAYAKRPRDVLRAGIEEVEAINKLARSAVRVSDAIWISGGGDISPAWYSYGDLSRSNLDRDILEIAVLDAQSQEPYKPLIGVCRGHQMINVFYGGTLRNQGQSGDNPVAVVKRDGHLGSALPLVAHGYSMHGQSVDKLAALLEVVAVADDGMVKALQYNSKDVPLMGTQFHPEYPSRTGDTHELIFERFINMAAASKRQTCFEPGITCLASQNWN